MKKKQRLSKFNKTAKFSVQWTKTGVIKPIASPAFLRGENPYILKVGNTYLNVISGANYVTDKFFAKVGGMYQKQFDNLSNDEQQRVKFPVVQFSITVNGVVDPDAMLIERGEAVATGKVQDLHGKVVGVSVREKISKFNASLHSGVIGSAPHEGDKDPACYQAGGYWSGCRDFGACTAIVKDIFGGCWTTYCGWDWSYWQCGCEYKKRVACP